MKFLWSVLSVFAVANLLAAGAFVAWLVTSDRLDMDRARRVREVLATTIAQDAVKAKDAQAQAKADAAKAAEAARLERPAITSDEAIASADAAARAARQADELARRQVQDMLAALEHQRAALVADRDALRREREAFESLRQRDAAALGDQQFRKTVGVLSALKPAAAKQALSTLLTQSASVPSIPGSLPEAGPASLSPPAANQPAILPPAASPDEGRQRVVAYLNAMQERTRTRILEEFIKDDPALAADLLERLRTLGAGPRVSQGRSP